MNSVKILNELRMLRKAMQYVTMKHHYSCNKRNHCGGGDFISDRRCTCGFTKTWGELVAKTPA